AAGARAAVDGAREAAVRLGANVAEYLAEESRLLAGRPALEALAADIAAEQARLEALQARAGPLERRFRALARRPGAWGIAALLRFARIVFVCLRYGLDELVVTGLNRPLATALLRVARLGMRPKAPRGVRLRRALESLGPIFVKFGQVLSTRRD